jgi:serine/threonine protein kinase
MIQLLISFLSFIFSPLVCVYLKSSVIDIWSVGAILIEIVCFFCSFYIEIIFLGSELVYQIFHLTLHFEHFFKFFGHPLFDDSILLDGDEDKEEEEEEEEEEQEEFIQTEIEKQPEREEYILQFDIHKFLSKHYEISPKWHEILSHSLCNSGRFSATKLLQLNIFRGGRREVEGEEREEGEEGKEGREILSSLLSPLSSLLSPLSSLLLPPPLSSLSYLPSTSLFPPPHPLLFLNLIGPEADVYSAGVIITQMLVHVLYEHLVDVFICIKYAKQVFTL